MIAAMILETPRLRLRPLAAVDAEPCLALWTNPDVMRYVSPVPVTRAQAEAVFAHYRPQVEKTGYGHWAIEVKGGDAFAGIILLEKVKFTAAFTPAIEVGWLLAPDQWGNGYAPEPERSRRPDGGGQPGLATRDGAPWNDARSARRLRSPACGRHRAAAVRAVPNPAIFRGLRPELSERRRRRRSSRHAESA